LSSGLVALKKKIVKRCFKRRNPLLMLFFCTCLRLGWDYFYDMDLSLGKWKRKSIKREFIFSEMFLPKLDSAKLYSFQRHFTIYICIIPPHFVVHFWGTYFHHSNQGKYFKNTLQTHALTLSVKRIGVFQVWKPIPSFKDWKLVSKLMFG